MSDFFTNPYFSPNYFGGPYFMGQQGEEEEIPRTGGGWVIRFVWRPVEPVAPRVSLKDYVTEKTKKKPSKYPKKIAKTKQEKAPVVDFGRLGEIFQARPAVALAPPPIDIPAQVSVQDLDQDIELLVLLAA